MKTIFAAANHVEVRDGTLVSAFLNPFDDASGDPSAPSGMAVSLAEGQLSPGITSAIHVLPLVTQVTYVLEGALTAEMQDADDAAPYRLELEPGQAVATRPGELLRLSNSGSRQTRVLYLCSPAYVYAVADSGEIDYDDALTLGADWASAAAAARRLKTGSLAERQRQRAAAIARLAARQRA